jgi:hypothetical protein
MGPKYAEQGGGVKGAERYLTDEEGEGDDGHVVPTAGLGSGGEVGEEQHCVIARGDPNPTQSPGRRVKHKSFDPDRRLPNSSGAVTPSTHHARSSKLRSDSLAPSPTPGLRPDAVRVDVEPPAPKP